MIILNDGWYNKKILTEWNFLHVPFTIDFDLHNLSVWINSVLKANANTHLTWIVLKKATCSLRQCIRSTCIMILYKLCWLHKWVILKIVKPWKPLGLSGWQFPMLPSHAVNINIQTHTELILPFLSHPLCQVVCDTVQQLKTTTTFLFTNVLLSTLASCMGTYWIHSLYIIQFSAITYRK